MQIEDKYLKQAAHLHQTYPVVDAHLDLAGELLLRKKNGQEHPLQEQYLKNFRTAGINLVLSSVYLETSVLPEQGLRNTLDQISVLLEEIDKNKEFRLIHTSQDLDQAMEKNQIGILLYMEGLDGIDKDLKLLRILWELGVRGASLTWSRRNALASGCCRAGERVQIPGGLSPDGFQAIEEMERLDMFLDISHLNDDGFADVCRAAKRPFIATHSNSRSVAFHYRNLTDEQMDILASQGGIMGLNGCDCIVGVPEGADSLEWMCRHVEYEVKRIGDDHVGYGFDFCDSYGAVLPRVGNRLPHEDCLTDHSHVPELTAALLQRGMPEKSVKKIIGGNFIRYFREMLPSGI